MFHLVCNKVLVQIDVEETILKEEFCHIGVFHEIVLVLFTVPTIEVFRPSSRFDTAFMSVPESIIVSIPYLIMEQSRNTVLKTFISICFCP